MFPDCPATTGSNTASAVNWAIVASKIPTTEAARNAVARLICNHGSRLLTAKPTLDSARSSLPAPVMLTRSALSSVSTAETSWPSRITPIGLWS